MKRRNVILVVLILAIGFAAVTTTMIINGGLNIATNQEEFDVYFSKSIEDGIENNSLIKDKTHIEFSKDMSLVGEKYILDYDVTNGSRNYDAEISINCTESNEYVGVTNELDTTSILKSQETRRGKLTIEVIKGYVGDAPKDINITCTLTANAIERDKIADIPEKEVNEINLRWQEGTEEIDKRTMKAIWNEDNTVKEYEVGLLRNGEKVEFDESTKPSGATLLDNGNISTSNTEVDLTGILAKSTNGGTYKVTVNKNNETNTSDELKTLARLNDEDLKWDENYTTAMWKPIDGADYYLFWVYLRDGTYKKGTGKDLSETCHLEPHGDSGSCVVVKDTKVDLADALGEESGYYYEVGGYSDNIEEYYTPPYELGKSEIN